MANTFNMTAITSPASGDAYATQDEANTFMLNRVHNQGWVNATPTERGVALVDATSRIDRLNFIGTKTVSTQTLQFPRNNDTTIPTDIKNACALIANALLDGVDPEFEFENLSQTSVTYDRVKTTFDRSRLPEHFIAGIPSAEAWRFLKPYLRDNRSIHMQRVS